eukprot:2790870-Rhodomonas_salina.2
MQLVQCHTLHQYRTWRSGAYADSARPGPARWVGGVLVQHRTLRQYRTWRSGSRSAPAGTAIPSVSTNVDTAVADVSTDSISFYPVSPPRSRRQYQLHPRSGRSALAS